MNKTYINVKELQALLFERRQIVALLENTDLWRQIPLGQRLEIVESSEFVTLMGESFTADTKRTLESEIEALLATIH